MRALVSGATGMVGRHLVERLLHDGWNVRALVREPARAAELASRGVEIAQGNVLDADSFLFAARGTDLIFHAAAEIIAGGGWEAYRAANLDGTRNAIAAAAAARARLVHVSSVAVYGPKGRYAGPARGAKTSEETELGPLGRTAYYARSKRMSEQMVMEAHQRGVVWASAMRPCVIYGTRDRQLVPRLGRLLRTGFAPLLGTGRNTLSIVHAASVADGLVRAGCSDAAGGRTYNLANDGEITVREFFESAAAGVGRRVRFLRVPVAAARGLVAATTAAIRVATLGRQGIVGDSTVDFLTRDNPFTSERARVELGWNPMVDHRVAVRDAFAWWATSTGR